MMFRRLVSSEDSLLSFAAVLSFFSIVSLALRFSVAGFVESNERKTRESNIYMIRNYSSFWFIYSCLN